MQITREGNPKERSLKGMDGKLITRKFIPQVLTDQISRVLTEEILDGSLAPGTQLLELELQQQLGVSRTPLREAFRDLEKKGLAVILPRRGAFVREFTARDVRENFSVRACLEGLAARFACGKLSKQALDRMRSALEGMKRAGPTKNHDVYQKNHQEFHNIFIEASDNQLLISILQNLRMHRLWYFVSYRIQKLDFQPVTDEQHERIFNLFERESADPQELEQLVRGHIESGLDMLFRAMDDSQSKVSVPKEKGKREPPLKVRVDALEQRR